MIAPMSMNLKKMSGFCGVGIGKMWGVPPSPKEGQVDDNKSVTCKVFKRCDLSRIVEGEKPALTARLGLIRFSKIPRRPASGGERSSFMVQCRVHFCTYSGEGL